VAARAAVPPTWPTSPCHRMPL